MKNLLPILVLVGILLLSASLGFVMNHMNSTMSDSHVECPFGVQSIVSCMQNPIDSAVAHITIFAKFFLAIPVGSLLVFIAFVLLSLVYLAPDWIFLRPKPAFAHTKFADSLTSPNRILFNHWFALHENSPAFIRGRFC